MTMLQLRLAVEIAGKGSITAAADELKISQPNASSALKKLEKELGYAIFRRYGRTSTPTEQGYLFLEHAHAVLREEQSMHSLSSEKRISRLRVGIMNYTPMIKAFIRYCSENQQDSTGDSSCINVSPEYSVGLLKERVLDIAVSVQLKEMLPMSEKMCADNGLVMSRLAQIPICVRVRKGHPLAENGTLDGSLKGFQQLKNYPYVQYRNLEQLKKVYTLPLSVPFGCCYQISVDERDTRMKILGATDAYSVGCKIPDTMLDEYGLISFPTGINASIVTYIRKGDKAIPSIKRYFELLKDELKKY